MPFLPPPSPPRIKKPPLGAKPETLHEEERLLDLAKAIYDHVDGGYFSSEYAIMVKGWCDELSRRLDGFR